MATLDDLKDILESIDRTMVDQKDLLTNMFNLQETRSRLSSVDTTTTAAASTGQSVGAAAAGIGQGVGSTATGLGIGGLLGLAALSVFGDFDADAVKENVVTLLSISDEVGGKVETLKEGGAFFLAMTGIGLGLAAFGVGQSIVALGQWVTDDNWTNVLKTNVIDLLSIGDAAGGDLSMLFEGGALLAALYGLGQGLKAFGVGQTLVGLGQWLTDDTWAEQVKQNVLTLISIGEEIPEDVSALDESSGFFFAMSGLAAGLAAFGVGQTLVGLGQWLTDDTWAQQIKDNVITLLSISELPGIGWDTAGFVATMVGISAGLAAFAFGKGANVLVEGASDALNYFTGDEPFADRIKSEVTTLLSIVGLAPEGSVDEFVSMMSRIGDSLSSFGGSNFMGTLKNAGAAIIGFFFGTESPFEQIRDIYQNADALKQGADALDKLTGALQKIGDLKFDGSNLNIKAFAEDLAEAVPAIEAAIMGGEIAKLGMFNDISFKGLASPDIDYTTAISNINKLKEVLGLQTVEVEVGAASVTLPPSAENARLTDSVAAAVAESQLVSINAEQVRIETETATINRFQAQAELVSKPDRDRQGQATVIDASDKSVKTEYKAGPTYVSNNILQPSTSKNDLDYYFAN